jgi:hypothetical protein
MNRLTIIVFQLTLFISNSLRFTRLKMSSIINWNDWDKMPPKRNFIQFNKSPYSYTESSLSISQAAEEVKSVDDNDDDDAFRFRVLQFNMLADGLSGLRLDLGAFSRLFNALQKAEVFVNSYFIFI